jgi:hypothetical protein
MPSQSPYVLNPVSIHGEYIQLQALTGTAPVAASQSVGRIFASGSTAQLYFINEGGTVQALGGADPPTADGDTLGTADKEWSDLYMADGSVIYLGNDQEVTMTHIHDTGVRLNGAMKLQFRDADVHVSSDANGYLNAQADTGVNLNVNGTDRVLVTSAGASVVGTLSGSAVTVDAITSTGISTFGSSKHTTVSGTVAQINQDRAVHRWHPGNNHCRRTQPLGWWIL